MIDATCALVRLVGACPDCGHHHLKAVFDGQEANFRCRLCGACWRSLGASVDRIDPLTCGRCRSRPLCLSVPEVDPPRAA